MAKPQRIDLPGGRTWTVVDSDWKVVEPVEEYLEFLRNTDRSPNTVKSYACGLALWWSFLEETGSNWREVGLSTIGTFLGRLRRGQLPGKVVELHPTVSFSEATLAARIRAVMSFYRYHELSTGLEVADKLYERVWRPGPYRPFLDHIARRAGQLRSRVRVRGRTGPTPLLTPDQIATILDTAATWDQENCRWVGNLRNRLLWHLLEETGMRLGEALSLQHRDWTSGRGTTAFVEIVDRPHPHGLGQKSGYRKIYIGSDLDRLYGEYLWELSDQGADVAVTDLDAAYVFCNLDREPRFAPIRPETVYLHVAAVKRQHPELPGAWTPHWFRHTHATALLFAGVDPVVVSRRLGHRDVQTTLNTYAHVTADADLRALANWRAWIAGWGAEIHAQD